MMLHLLASKMIVSYLRSNIITVYVIITVIFGIKSLHSTGDTTTTHITNHG